MDNREAMIAEFNKSVFCPYMSEDDLHLLHERALISTNELNEKRAIKLAFKIAWQAATAHNTDAVIDKCVNFLKSQIENINDGSIASALDIYVDHLSESLRSLKTNKEG